MKVLVSRQHFLPRLNTYLILYCCLIFLSTQRCNARVVNQENSASKVVEEHGTLSRGPIIEASEINEGLSIIDGADVFEKRDQRFTDTLGKSDKETVGAKKKDVTIAREAKNDENIQSEEIVEIHFNESGKKRLQEEEPTGFKMLTKKNARLIKRDDQNVQESKKSIENSMSDIVENVEHTENIDGIRRLDVDIEEDKKDKFIENGNASQNEELLNRVAVEENPIKVDLNENNKILKTIQKNSQDSSEKENLEEISSRADTFPKLKLLKAQALELQQKIRNNTFLQNLKEQTSDILPDFPKFTEKQYLDILKSISSKIDANQFDDFNIDRLKNNGLNDVQIEIIKCANRLVKPAERKSFVENLSDCIRGLSIQKCIRLYIAPTILEYMPEAVTQGFQNLPIEINLSDLLQGNRDKPKLARQAPIFGFYISPSDPDTTIFDILMEGLLRNPPNENLPSYIDAKNDSFSKILTCNKLQLLQMTEKFLPEYERRKYSEEMLSCVKRFEYFSCIKYFSWPAIRRYYPSLPLFPLSDSVLSSLIYPNYPLVTYPGSEQGLGQLPEVIEAGQARMKPEIIIMQILQKTLNDYPRIITPPTPIQLDLISKSQLITREQIASIHIAEQLLPVSLRSEYVLRTVQCIQQYNYYNCMKYASWPVLRQFNPTIPQVPSLQQLADMISTLPPFSYLFNFFSQFQLPQFQPPTIPNFQIPDFSAFWPFGQQTPMTSKPQVEQPTANDTAPADNKNNIALESRVYQILKNVRDSMGATPLSPATYTNRKVFLFPLMTEEQSKIFALAEGIVPPIAREPLITSVYFCLNDKNEFSSCAKSIIWPSIRIYVKSLPEFPSDNNNFLKQANEYVPIASISAGEDNFFIIREIEKYFVEGREDAINYIVRSIQLSNSEPLNMRKILEMLRSIQYNTPEFSNIPVISYPRIPEFSSILTEYEENIVHVVESILPEQLRSKFRNEMIECEQKNKFALCSRNIIFPYIYSYFQKALSAPYITHEKKPFPNINTLELNRIHSMPIETNINPEKPSENFILLQNQALPILPTDPELTIFSMLRKEQICATTLPDKPKESIAYTPEFHQVFSNRQAQLLTVAEAILPEEYRKGFLEKMFECNQKDLFLNCTRDILFPVMKKAYQAFPDFPNFENEFDKTNMLSVINSINKLIQESYYDKKTLPSMEILYKFLPDDKSNVLKILVDKLPSSLYYDLYLKMTQCTQYSDAISCGHDVIYPTLKNYYDAPNFNIDDYYPITANPPFYSTMENQRSLLNYELFCENMGYVCTLLPLGTRYGQETLNSNTQKISYIPFGKLADGSRIFKQVQDVWNLNITSSVGSATTSFSKHTIQSSASNINLSTKPSNYFQIKQNIDSQNIKKSASFLKRNKRNVDDLLDSYSHAIPDNKKNSVPRRIPPKSTFPNITETELLQILIYIAKHKNEPVSENKDITDNEYFVDSLNDTEKAFITADQYEILKLVQDLDPEAARAGFMTRLIQCIRSLSFLRCIGIFAWPMIVSNLPFNLQSVRDSSEKSKERQIQELFGLSSAEFETELISRKEEIESNFIQWYKSLTENKFEINVGPLKLKGHGDGELAVSFSSFREGRLSKFKDNKNLPSILTIISEVIEEIFDTKSNKTKNKKDNSKKDKRNRSLRSFRESDYEKVLKDSSEEQNLKRSLKDDQVISILLDKLRPTVSNIKDRDTTDYFTEGAHRAFQVLFGPKTIEKVSKPTEIKKFKNFEEIIEALNPVDELKLLPLEVQDKNIDKLKIMLPKSRAIYGFDDVNDKVEQTEDSATTEKLSKFKTYFSEYIKNYLNLNKKKLQTGLVMRLPKLNDEIIGRKMTDNLSVVGRGLKSKMKEMMPAAGIALSFIVHLLLAHAKAAASVSGLLSNMALSSAMIGMVRDMIFNGNDQSKVKVVYDTEKYDAGISWPSHSDSVISFTPPSKIYAPSPHFH